MWSLTAARRALHIRAIKLTRGLCAASGDEEPKRKCCGEPATQIAQGRAGRGKKLEQAGLEGLYNTNRGQSHIKFCLKLVKEKKKASLENVVEFHCAVFNSWYIALGSKLHKSFPCSFKIIQTAVAKLTPKFF